MPYLAQGTQTTVMGLAEKLLKLHAGIRVVFVAEQVEGSWRVVDEAVREGIILYADSMLEAKQRMAAMPMVLHLLDSIRGKAGKPTLAAVLYKKAGVVISQLTTKTIIAASCSLETFEEVVRIFRYEILNMHNQLA